MDQVAKLDDVHPDNIPLRPRFEINGAFGNDADTLVVFEVDESAEAAGLQVIAAFAGDQLVGVVSDPVLIWAHLTVAGITDLDGPSSRRGFCAVVALKSPGGIRRASRI